MKDYLSMPTSGWKYFNSSGTEEDEPIYIYNDKHMRWFIRQSFKGGRCWNFNRYYKSEICDDILKTFPEELNVKGNVYEIIQAYLKYKNE